MSLTSLKREGFPEWFKYCHDSVYSLWFALEKCVCVCTDFPLPKIMVEGVRILRAELTMRMDPN